jgi:hypothetical protein
VQASREQIGGLARQLQTSPAFKAIVAAMKANIITTWANEPDEQKRELLYRDVQAVGRLEAALQAAAQNLTMDERKAETAAKKARRGT